MTLPTQHLQATPSAALCLDAEKSEGTLGDEEKCEETGAVTSVIEAALAQQHESPAAGSPQ
jgi:hypothetical protein